MRGALLACLVWGCAPAPTPIPVVTDLRLANVHSAEGKAGEDVIIATWASPPPHAGEHWTIIDAKGFVADAVIDRAAPGECDHCERFRFIAHTTGVDMKRWSGLIAVGPASGPLQRARVLSSLRMWWNAKEPEKWVKELTVDVDGNGSPDLARWVRGPHVTYEIRARVGNDWIVLERWMTADVLDLEDK